VKPSCGVTQLAKQCSTYGSDLDVSHHGLYHIGNTGRLLYYLNEVLWYNTHGMRTMKSWRLRESGSGDQRSVQRFILAWRSFSTHLWRAPLICNDAISWYVFASGLATIPVHSYDRIDYSVTNKKLDPLVKYGFPAILYRTLTVCHIRTHYIHSRGFKLY